MTRHRTVAAGQRWKRLQPWAALLLAGLLLAAAWRLLQPMAADTMPAPALAWTPTAAVTVPAAEALRPASSAAAPAVPVATAMPPPAPVRQAAPAPLPYRYIGRMAQHTGTALVLFGQGRVVVLQGPGPLDEAHVVEAVLDNALLVRHLPSGRGLLLPQDTRPPAAWTVHDPETLERD